MIPANQNPTSKSVQILAYFFNNFRGRTILVGCVMALAGLLESANLAALYPIINYGLNIQPVGNMASVLTNIIKTFGNENLFYSSCLFLIVITILAAIAKICFHFLSNLLIRDIVTGTQKSIFDKFLNSEYSYFVGKQQGKLIYAGTIAPIGVSNVILYSIRIAHASLTSLFLIAILMMLSWQGVAITLIMGACYTLGIKKLLNNVVNKYARMTVEEDGHKNIILNEFITGIKPIKVFQNYEMWQKKYHNVTERSGQFSYKVMLARALPETFLKMMFFLGLAGMGIALSAQKSDMLFLLPAMGTFVTVASRLIPYVNLIGNDVVGVARYLADARIVYEILHENPVEKRPGQEIIQDFRNKIVFNNLWFKYDGTEEPVLKGVNFEIEHKKVTAIVGSSGSGKSSLIHLLLRLYEAPTNSIKIDGKSLESFELNSYLNLFGFVSQETFLFNGTIRENILFGQKGVSDNDLKEAIKLANAEDFIFNTAKGLDTYVGDAGVKLSGGQRQRIAIARAMLRKPKVIIFDEATSFLDNVSESAVQEAIQNIAYKTTVLIVAHRLSTVQKADKIIVLNRGEIVESGTHEELLGRKEAYYQLFTA